MILPDIPTQNQKLRLNIQVQCQYPLTLEIFGVDANRPKTTFFHRLATPDHAGVFNLDFPMPVSPQNLRMYFSNASDGNENAYSIKTISADYLPRGIVALTPDEKEFMDFYIPFCENASYSPNGIYFSKSRKYFVNYMPEIVDDQLGVLTTPARVDHSNGEMQIASNQFRGFSIPIRAVIGVHEFGHWKYDTKDEILCDINALRICLGYGFPKSEMLYAFTNIFNDNKEGRERIAYIQRYINNFKYNNTGGKL